MIETGILLGVVIWAGVMFLFMKMPAIIRNLFRRCDTVLDIAVSIGAFFALGQTVTALIASAILGLLTSATLFTTKRIRSLLAG